MRNPRRPALIFVLGAIRKFGAPKSNKDIFGLADTATCYEVGWNPTFCIADCVSGFFMNVFHTKLLR